MKKKNNGGRRRQSSSVKQRDGVHLLSSRRAGKSAPPSTLSELELKNLKRAQRKRSRPEAIFEAHLRASGYRDFVTEHRFMTGRRFRFDFAWLTQKVAIEIEGGIFMRGRHVRPSGFINDAEKYNAATLQGWRVYRIPVCKGWLDAAMLYVQTERLT